MGEMNRPQVELKRCFFPHIKMSQTHLLKNNLKKGLGEALPTGMLPSKFAPHMCCYCLPSVLFRPYCQGEIDQLYDF